MENINVLDGILFAKMVTAGCNNLRKHLNEVNDLNVFPIPDGDTGSNMLMTVLGGAENFDGEKSLHTVSRKISDGMLMAARGNSGVILSQIFDGIAEGFSSVEEADATVLACALQEGVKHSYGAVMEPTEGTVLTVMRCATEYVTANSMEDIESLLKGFLNEAKRTLDMTPEMLPVLKKAGVVDSGGAGLVYIFEGMLNALTGEEESVSYFENSEKQLNFDLFTEESVLEYGYCTEMLVRLQKSKTDIRTFSIDLLTEELKEIGDSVVAVKTGSVLKVHIHTFTPDKVIAICRKYGEFLKVKIENMQLQHNNITVKEKRERKKYGVVAVASGEGIKNLFTERGVDVIVDGGQSNNPSAEDFISAFEEVNADTVFVFPNNSNVILTAKQAGEMYKESDVRVIESRTVGDGYASLSMLSFDSGDTLRIEEELKNAMDGVVTVEISKSIRNTEDVNAGDYIGFIGKDILFANSERISALCGTVDKIDGEFDTVILIYGNDVDTEEVEEVTKFFEKNYPNTELYPVDGKQEIYDYILIAE